MEIFYLDDKDMVRSIKNLASFKAGTPAWIRLTDPTEDKIKAISDHTNIPIEEFTDFLEDEERSRVEQGKYLQIIYRAPFSDKDELMTTSISIFFVNHMFVTVERERIFVLERLSSLLRAGKLKFLFKKTAGYFVYNIFDKLNDEFLNGIQKIGSSIKKLKMDYADTSEKQLVEIYNSNITLSHYNHALIANIEVLNVLRKSYLRVFTKRDLQRFNDLYYDTLQIIDTEKIQRDVLATRFNFQTILSSYRLNRFMERITALALIIAIPTLISSIYGMNVANMPLARHPAGFFFLVVGMVGISVFAYYVLKKLDWF